MSWSGTLCGAFAYLFSLQFALYPVIRIAPTRFPVSVRLIQIRVRFATLEMLLGGHCVISYLAAKRPLGIDPKRGIGTAYEGYLRVSVTLCFGHRYSLSPTWVWGFCSPRRSQSNRCELAAGWIFWQYVRNGETDAVKFPNVLKINFVKNASQGDSIIDPTWLFQGLCFPRPRIRKYHSHDCTMKERPH